MRRFVRAVALAALTVALVLPASTVAEVPVGITVYIDDDGTAGASGCDGGTAVPTDLQTAVDTVGLEGTIWVCPGTYVGQVTIEGSGLDGLTIRAVTPWTAILRPPAEASLEYLVSIDDADRVTLRHLNLQFPGRRSPCRTVDHAVLVRDARKARILANRMVAQGAGTYHCGFRDGVVVKSGDGAKPQTATVAWNLIQDFGRYGIDICVTGPSRIHRNSIRFLHLAEPYRGSPSGKGIYGNSGSGCGPGPVVITDNVITSPSSAQLTTNVLTEAMEIQCCVTELSGNVARYVQVGFLVNSRDQATVVEDNVLVGTLIDPKPFTRGIRALGIDLPFVIQDNTISSFGIGVRVERGAGSTIADNDLAANDAACVDISGETNTWTNNLGCPDGPVIPAP